MPSKTINLGPDAGCMFHHRGAMIPLISFSLWLGSEAAPPAASSKVISAKDDVALHKSVADRFASIETPQVRLGGFPIAYCHELLATAEIGNSRVMRAISLAGY